MKDSVQSAQLTNTESKERACHKPFLKQATLTMIQNLNELKEEITRLKRRMQKITTESTNNDQAKINNPPQ